jgi:transposase
MLSVDHYELIRRKHLIEGLSIRAICRELGHSRKTIRKVLAHGTPPGYQRCQPVASPVMDKVARIVDAWLEQDRQRPPKQRHTAQRIYERLRDEHEFTGSACTVRRYVSKLKATGQEVFMPLQFNPGEEAQVDPPGVAHRLDCGQWHRAQGPVLLHAAVLFEGVIGHRLRAGGYGVVFRWAYPCL